ncbi:MAG: CopG family transcriptional regulator [Candidatus Parabeggiatoa sp. nov. 3]|nr:MAG: CopG family transcriptional regulator [Gammaproteobacteria bacterium]RKZ62299.1 MAG: CopG family transcriptional regulator [Gammaproteobacteria bacterium]RKZ86379.1 MAG: CopG family transcriptional regulator [Gammaproteobacteria bacterium]
MSTLTIEISPRLEENILQFVSSGWFKNIDGLVEEALRRYLESHTVDLMEQFIQEDIEWGLYGNDFQ